MGSFLKCHLLGPTLDLVNQNPGAWIGIVRVVIKLRRCYLLKVINEWKKLFPKSQNVIYCMMPFVQHS